MNRRNYRKRKVLAMPLALLMATLMVLGGPAWMLVAAGVEAGQTAAPMAGTTVDPSLARTLATDSDAPAGAGKLATGTDNVGWIEVDLSPYENEPVLSGETFALYLSASVGPDVVYRNGQLVLTIPDAVEPAWQPDAPPTLNGFTGPQLVEPQDGESGPRTLVWTLSNNADANQVGTVTTDLMFQFPNGVTPDGTAADFAVRFTADSYKDANVQDSLASLGEEDLEQIISQATETWSVEKTLLTGTKKEKDGKLTVDYRVTVKSNNPNGEKGRLFLTGYELDDALSVLDKKHENAATGYRIAAVKQGSGTINLPHTVTYDAPSYGQSSVEYTVTVEYDMAKYTIPFKVGVTDTTMPKSTVRNTATLAYTTVGGQTGSSSDDADISLGWMGPAPAGASYQFEKQIQIGSQAPETYNTAFKNKGADYVGDFAFHLYSDAAGTVPATSVTGAQIEPVRPDADGKVTFTGLPKGTYYIKEMIADASSFGYESTESGLREIEIGEENKIYENQAPWVNKATKGVLEIVKKGQTYTGAAAVPIGGIKFELYDGINKVGETETGTDGIVRFTGLDPDKMYTLKEASTKEELAEYTSGLVQGLTYGADFGEDGTYNSDITVTAGEKKTLNITNPTTQGGLAVYKKVVNPDGTQRDYDGDKISFKVYTQQNGGTPLANPTITISKENDPARRTVYGLPAGDYWLEEVSTDNTLQKLTARIPVTITAGEVTEETVVNYSVKRQVKFSKWDSKERDAEKNMGGTQITIYSDAEGKVKVSTITNPLTIPNGQNSVTADLPAGTYYYQETRAPEGYLLGTEGIQSFTVAKLSEGDTAVAEYKLYNDKKLTLTLKKVDGDDQPITSGDAKFDVYKKNGVNGWDKITFAAGETEVDGAVYTFKNLTAGDYKVVETQAPAGYDLPVGNAAEFFITLPQNAGEPTKIENLPTNATLIVKKVDEKGSVISDPDVKFALYATTGGSSSQSVWNWDTMDYETVNVPNYTQVLELGNLANGLHKSNELEKGKIYYLFEDKGTEDHLKMDGALAKIVVDAKGQVTISNLKSMKNGQWAVSAPNGSYYRQTAENAPNIIVPNLRRTVVDLTKLGNDAGRVNEDTENPEDLSRYEYALNGAEFELYVRDKGSDEPLLLEGSNGVYRLKARAENGVSATRLVTSTIGGSKGKLRIDGLTPLNTYVLKEVKAPEGYAVSPKEHVLTFTPFDASADNVYEVTAYNDMRLGQIRVVKRGYENYSWRLLPENTPMLDGRFVVIKGTAAESDVKALAKAAAGNNGFEAELAALSAYIAYDSIYTGTEFDKPNTGLSPWLPLAQDNTSFYVVELKAPYGYEINGEGAWKTVSFGLNDAGKTQNVTFKNKQKTGGGQGTHIYVQLPILKLERFFTDGNNYVDRPLNNAKFNIYHNPNDGDPVLLSTALSGTGKDAQDGWALTRVIDINRQTANRWLDANKQVTTQISEIAYYEMDVTIEEVEVIGAAKDYVLAQPQSFTIRVKVGEIDRDMIYYNGEEGAGKIPFTFVNVTDEVSITVTKNGVKQGGGAPSTAGTQFTLEVKDGDEWKPYYDEDGAVILTTAGSGSQTTATYGPLQRGLTYRLTEIVTATGYNKSEQSEEFTAQDTNETVTFTNYAYADVKVVKTAVGGAAITGNTTLTYALYEGTAKSGTPMQTLTSENSYTANALPDGKYFLIETEYEHGAKQYFRSANEDGFILTIENGKIKSVTRPDQTTAGSFTGNTLKYPNPKGVAPSFTKFGKTLTSNGATPVSALKNTDAVFVLYNSSDVEVERVTGTDANGKVTFKTITIPGDYYVVEETAPVGYAANTQTKYAFTVKHAGDNKYKDLTIVYANANWHTQSGVRGILNESLYGALKVQKVWAGTKPTGAKATFALYKMEDGERTDALINSQDTSASNIAYFADLLPGDYWLEETGISGTSAYAKAPGRKVTVENALAITTVTVKNPKLGSIDLWKQDATLGFDVWGASFALYAADGNGGYQSTAQTTLTVPMHESTRDNHSVLIFGGLDTGRYKAVEETPAPGYEGSAWVGYFELTYNEVTNAIDTYFSASGEDGSYVKVASGGHVVPNERSGLLIKIKKTGENDAPLPGVAFKVYAGENTQGTLLTKDGDNEVITTGADGIAWLPVSEAAHYHVVEVATAAGYTLDPAHGPLSWTLSKNDANVENIIELSVTNRKQQSDIKASLTKTASYPKDAQQKLPSLYEASRTVAFTLSEFAKGDNEMVLANFTLLDQDIKLYADTAKNTVIANPGYTIKAVTVNPASQSDGRTVYAKINDGTPVALDQMHTLEDFDEKSLKVEYGTMVDDVFVHEVGVGFTAGEVTLEVEFAKVNAAADVSEVLAIGNTAKVSFTAKLYGESGAVREIQKTVDRDVALAVAPVSAAATSLAITKVLEDVQGLFSLEKSYRITVKNTGENPLPLPVLIDRMPDRMGMKSYEIVSESTAAQVGDPIVEREGKLAVWKFPGTLPAGETITLRVVGSIDQTTPSRTEIVNTAYVTSAKTGVPSQNNPKGTIFSGEGWAEGDTSDLDEAIDWSGSHPNAYLKATATFNLANNDQQVLIKKVSGDLDDGADLGPTDTARATAGGTVRYTMEYANNTLQVMTNLRIADRLPAKDDYYLLDTSKRGTEWTQNSPFKSVKAFKVIHVTSSGGEKTLIEGEDYTLYQSSDKTAKWDGTFDSWSSWSRDSIPVAFGVALNNIEINNGERVLFVVEFNIHDEEFDSNNYGKLGKNTTAYVADKKGSTMKSNVVECNSVKVTFEPEKAKIGNLVWRDLDGSGIQQGGDRGIEGATVTLYKMQENGEFTVAGTVQTGADGLYGFEALISHGEKQPDNPAGGYTTEHVYKLHFAVPEQYALSPRYAGEDGALDSDPDGEGATQGFTDPFVVIKDGSADQVVMLQGDRQGQVLAWDSLDAGAYLRHELGGLVWLDEDLSGLRDEHGEPIRISQVEVELYDGLQDITPQSVPIDRQNTKADGSYLFTDLMPGAYIVRFKLEGVSGPGGQRYYFTRFAQGAAQGSDAVVDIEDATGRLTKSANTQAVTVGEAEGNVYDVDAGVYLLGSVGDTVWHDRDYDGLQEGGEEGVEGIEVRLQAFNGNDFTDVLADYEGTPYGTVRTDGQGKYAFNNLLPGTYRVIFGNTTQDGKTYRYTRQGAGSGTPLESKGDETDGVTERFDIVLASATDAGQQTFLPGNRLHRTDIDQGLWLTGAIGDYVWYDSNRNGLQDDGQMGLNNMRVELYRLEPGSDAAVLDNYTIYGTTLTANHPQSGMAGYYLFDNLPVGEYRVRFYTSPGYPYFTQKAQGADRALDSDAQPSGENIGWTDVVQVLSGTVDTTIDAGLYYTSDDTDTPPPTVTTTPPQTITPEPGIVPFGPITPLTSTPRYLIPDDRIPYGYVPKPANGFVDIEEDPIPYGPTTKTGQMSGEFFAFAGIGLVIVAAGVLLLRKRKPGTGK